MLEKLRKQVLEQARLAEKLDLCQSGGGNFSMVDRQKKLVAITPHDTDRFTMSWRDVVVIDFDGNQVAGTEELRASSEKFIHLAVYKARKDVKAVAHTHAAFVCVFAALSMEVRPVLTEAMTYNFRCPLAPFAKPSSPELADSIIRTLGEDGLATVMEKHGLLTISTKDIEDAVRINLYVEETAKCYHRMIQLVGVDKANELCISEAQLKDCINYLSSQKYRNGI